MPLTINDLDNLPHILAGPIVRKVSAKQVTFWLITKSSDSITLLLRKQAEQSVLFEHQLDDNQHKQIQIGEHAFVHLISVSAEQRFPIDAVIEYDLKFESLFSFKAE